MDLIQPLAANFYFCNFGVCCGIDLISRKRRKMDLTQPLAANFYFCNPCV